MLTFHMLGVHRLYEKAFDFSRFDQARKEYISRMRARSEKPANHYWREICAYAAETGYSLDP
jgi:hypothetical protein